ncbi:MAG TPA: hypothetical protein VFY33_05205, partial [Solirubrobacterales bacterium]|nr:hypothetical protein [Solirubrobacterales bacterium]
MAVVALLAGLVLAAHGSIAPAKKPAVGTGLKSSTQRAVFVGNNWEGTADVLRFRPPSGSKPGGFTRIARMNIIPDIDERMAEIVSDPVRLAYFLAIREFVGE